MSCESVTPVCSVTSVDTDCEWRVVVGTRRTPLEDGWWEAGWSGSVMAPRGLERLHTDTGYGDGSYLGLGPGQVLGHVLPDQRLAQLQPHVVRQSGVRTSGGGGGRGAA